MPAVLVKVPTVMQNLLHPLSTSSIIARHLLDFMMHGKITEADALIIHLDATTSGQSVPPPTSSSIFMPNAFSAATLPIYPGLRQGGSIAEWLVCWTDAQKAWVQIAAAMLSGNSLRKNCSNPSCLCSPSSKIGSSPLKGCWGNCRYGGKSWQPTAGFTTHITCRLTAKN